MRCDMGSIIVFVVGIAAMFASAGLIWRYRETTRPPALELSLEMPAGSRFALVAQRACGMVTAAVVAGWLVPGIGGRLMMRLLGATSPESAQGRLTDADEIVGRVTLGGSFGLIFFIGLVGGLTTLGMFVLLRPWLPARSVSAGFVGAAIGGGLLARPTGFIDPDNHDFRILSPAWLAVLSALIVVVLYGVLFAVLTDRWASQWPPLNRSIRGILASLPGVAALAFGIAAVLPGVIIAVMVLIAVFLKPRLDQTKLRKTEWAGRGVTGLAAVAGGTWLLINCVQILRL